tara:strand:- start:73 stop:1014 length:942 start_codon:yes stop_codon:yes gene_type:complete
MVGIYRMEYGFVLPKSINSDDLCHFAQKVEEFGFGSIWASDHVVLPIDQTSQYPYTADGRFTSGPYDPQLDPLILLSFVGSATTKVKIGTSVIIVPYRNPIVQAKMLATLDVLSAGRLVCGIGVGWLEEEFDALGASYFDRGSVTDEYLQIFKALWSSDRPEFHGDYYQFSGIGFEPKPIQKPLPIWVGGHTRRAVRRTVKYGNAWHPTRQSPEYVISMIPYIQRVCEELGRSPKEITVSLKRTLYLTDIGLDLSARIQSGAALINTTQKVVDDVRKCEESGIDQLTFDFPTNNVDECIAIMEHFGNKVSRLL